MNYKLLAQAIIKFILGLVIVSALIFIPAGTLKYAGGLIFVGVLTILFNLIEKKLDYFK